MGRDSTSTVNQLEFKREKQFEQCEVVPATDNQVEPRVRNVRKRMPKRRPAPPVVKPARRSGICDRDGHVKVDRHFQKAKYRRRDAAKPKGLRRRAETGTERKRFRYAFDSSLGYPGEGPAGVKEHQKCVFCLDGISCTRANHLHSSGKAKAGAAKRLAEKEKKEARYKKCPLGQLCMDLACHYHESSRALLVSDRTKWFIGSNKMSDFDGDRVVDVPVINTSQVSSKLIEQKIELPSPPPLANETPTGAPVIELPKYLVARAGAPTSFGFGRRVEEPEPLPEPQFALPPPSAPVADATPPPMEFNCPAVPAQAESKVPLSMDVEAAENQEEVVRTAPVSPVSLQEAKDAAAESVVAEGKVTGDNEVPAVADEEESDGKFVDVALKCPYDCASKIIFVASKGQHYRKVPHRISATASLIFKLRLLFQKKRSYFADELTNSNKVHYTSAYTTSVKPFFSTLRRFVTGVEPKEVLDPNGPDRLDVSFYEDVFDLVYKGTVCTDIVDAVMANVDFCGKNVLTKAGSMNASLPNKVSMCIKTQFPEITAWNMEYVDTTCFCVNRLFLRETLMRQSSSGEQVRDPLNKSPASSKGFPNGAASHTRAL